MFLYVYCVLAVEIKCFTIFCKLLNCWEFSVLIKKKVRACEEVLIPFETGKFP